MARGQRAVIVRCNDSNTGSFGCVLRSADDIYKVALGADGMPPITTMTPIPSAGPDMKSGAQTYVYNASSLASLLSNDQVAQHLRCFDVYTDPSEASQVDIYAFRDFLLANKDSLAIKVFRGGFKDPSKRTEKVFEDELHRIRLLEQKLDKAHFENVTTYKKYINSYAFVIRPVSDSVSLIIQHKPDYRSIALDALCMILQESCVTSVNNLFATADLDVAARRSLLEALDQDISHTMRVLHTAGIAHCDIKPTNIVYCPQSKGRVFKLIDYGLLQDTAACKALPARLTGTKMYMSPFYVAAVAKGVPGLIKDTFRDTCNSFTHDKTRIFFKELLRLYITSIRDYTSNATVRYILLKNDEYAYMTTLCSLYDVTLERRLLRKAMMIALNPGMTFACGP